MIRIMYCVRVAPKGEKPSIVRFWKEGEARDYVVKGGADFHYVGKRHVKVES